MTLYEKLGFARDEKLARYYLNGGKWFHPKAEASDCVEEGFFLRLCFFLLESHITFFLINDAPIFLLLRLSIFSLCVYLIIYISHFSFNCPLLPIIDILICQISLHSCFSRRWCLQTNTVDTPGWRFCYIRRRSDMISNCQCVKVYLICGNEYQKRR